MVLGRKSARKLIPAVILYSPRPRFDHLTGGVQTAGICRSQSKSASNPTREQRHQRNKLTHHLDRRLELLPCLRRFIEQIAGCTKAFRGTPPPRPVSCTNASRENETVLPKSPMHNRYDARRSSRPRRPRLSRSSRVRGHGGKPRGSPGAAKSPRATRSRSGSDRCRKNPASLRQSHAAPALRSATPPQRRLPRPRRRSNQREPDTGRVGQSGDQRVTSDPIARIGSMKLGRR